MKKYLMTGIAALAMCAGFTSCSHDLEAPSQEEINEVNAQKVTETYNRAFIAKFGQPAADQDWGFSYSTSARTRSFTPTDTKYKLTSQTPNHPNVPDQPTFRTISKPTFTATVPANTPEATSTTNLAQGATYQIKTGDLNQPQNTQNMTFYVVDDLTWSKQINKDGNGTTFIITEGKTLTYTQSEALNLKIYMAPNSHLVIGDNVTFKKDGAMLYVGSGCTVTCGTNVLFAEKYTVLNEGTFTANKLNIEEGTLFYNSGTLTVNTGIEIQKTYGNNEDMILAELVNHSTLTSPKISLLAGGKMYNDAGATATVNGLTEITNTNSEWRNDGTYTSEDFIVKNANKVWNNCKLTVHKTDNTGTFTLCENSHSSFVINGASSVQTDKFVWGPDGDFYMADKSMLEVLGEFKTKNQNKGYGMHGPSTGNAVFKAGSVVYEYAGQNRMNYYGNLWVDTENHFAQVILDKNDASETADQPYYWFDTTNKTVKFRFLGDGCPITSAISGSCHHGYNPPSTTIEYETRIIGEDLTPGETDWDFNDVVFAVEFSGTTANCTLLAAGGTLPLRIYTVANEQNPEQNFVEVHELFGVNTNVMVNTGGISTTVDKKPTFSVTGVDSSKRGKDIIIRVNKGTSDKPNWVELKAEKGDPAAKLAVSKNFKVCTERQNINTVYTRFSDWVADKGVIWY